VTVASTEFAPGFLADADPPAPTVTVYSVLVSKDKVVSAPPVPPEDSLLSKDER